MLGPNGCWWLKDRVDGVIDVLAGHRVKEAVPDKGCVRLALDGPARSSVDADHVIAGTGFRVDFARLPFRLPTFRSTIKSLNGHPLVGRSGETSVPSRRAHRAFHRAIRPVHRGHAHAGSAAREVGGAPCADGGRT